MSERVDVATRMRALADAPWVARGDTATQAALREGADAVERLTAVARGAQYREREALAVVDVLRARLDRALDERDEAENRAENLEIALTITIGPRVDEVRRALAQTTAPDLDGLARREAGGRPTGRAWAVTVGEGSEGR